MLHILNHRMFLTISLTLRVLPEVSLFATAKKLNCIDTKTKKSYAKKKINEANF